MRHALALTLIAAFGLAGCASTASAGEPLLAERFADAKALEAWTIADGARSGDGTGPASALSIDGGALRLEASLATRRWLALTRAVPLGDARAIRVSVRMRTEGVDPGPAVFKNCNVFVQLPGRRIEAVRVLSGTQDWTPLARRFAVPPGGGSVIIGCFLSMPGRAWFDDVVVEPIADAWTEKRADGFVYRTLPGDRISSDAHKFNVESLRLVRAFFDAKASSPAGDVVFHKYPDVDAKAEWTGDRGNAHVSGGEIHSIWAADRHEIVHVFATRAWGDTSSALIGEGLAVHLSGAWQKAPVRRAAAAVLERKEWVPLPDLVATAQLRTHPDARTYPIAGAFVEWVLATRDKPALRRLYDGATVDDALGMTAAAADEALRGWLEKESK